MKLIYCREKLMLHRPYSRLYYSLVETQSVCTPPYVLPNFAPTSRDEPIHTAKCLEAIESVAKLLAIPMTHKKHSPLFSCALALIVMGQASACNYVFEHGSPDYLRNRERIRLGLGIMKTQASHWGLARRSITEIKRIASNLLNTTAASAGDSTTVARAATTVPAPAQGQRQGIPVVQHAPPASYAQSEQYLALAPEGFVGFSLPPLGEDDHVP